MKLSRRTASVILTILFLIALVFVNRDILRFEYHDPLEHSFLPDGETKGYYYLSGTILLKPGDYEMTFSGTLPEKGSEISLIENDDTVFYNEEFKSPGEQAVFNFTISGHARNARIRLNYDPESGPIRITHIKISSAYVFYRETIITHLICDAVIVLFYLFLLLRIRKPESVFKLIPFLSDQNNEAALWILLLLTLLVNIPMLLPGKYLAGMDTLFHYSRIRGIAENLKAGIFPPRVELFWLDDVGYGVGLFYPEIFLVIPAILYLIGFPLYNISKLIWISTIFITLLTHYRAAKNISGGSRIAGISAAVFISLSIYRIQNQYMRDGLGETFAFIFLPLIVEGLFLVFRRRAGGWKILAVGFSGVLLNHLLSFVLAVVFTAIFLLTQIRKILKESGIIIDIVKAATLSIGVTAFFFFPMLEQKYAVPDLRINQIVNQTFQGEYSFTVHSVKSLLTLYHPSHVGTFYPGWAILIVPLLGIILWIRKEKGLHTAGVMTAAGVLILAASTRLFPWHSFQFFLHDIQYTWRLMQSGTVLLSIAGGIYIARFCENHSPVRVLTAQFLVCLLPAVPVVIALSDIYIQNTDDFFMFNNHIGQGEYLQGNVMRKYVQDNTRRIKDLSENAVFSGFRRKGLSLDFDFSQNAGEDIDFIVPFLYYKGYEAEIRSGGDPEKALTEAASDGFVRVRGTGSDSGHMDVWYEGTAIQKVSDWVSLITIIGWIIFEIRRYLSGKGRLRGSGTVTG